MLFVRHSVDHWEFAKGRGHLFATRMSFIVQIFSLLYSYRYIVTLCNVDCGGVIMCRRTIIVLDLLFFLFYWINVNTPKVYGHVRVILLRERFVLYICLSLPNFLIIALGQFKNYFIISKNNLCALNFEQKYFITVENKSGFAIHGIIKACVIFAGTIPKWFT